jgi:hypothetical protein
MVVGAWRTLDVPDAPPPTARSRAIAAVSLVAFFLCFTPAPM